MEERMKKMGLRLNVISPVNNQLCGEFEFSERKLTKQNIEFISA